MDTLDSSSSLNISDTSLLLRELLNVGKSTGSSLGVGQSGNLTTESLTPGAGGSGDASNTQTLSEFMKTMYNSAPAQQIVLQGTDDNNSFSVYGREVNVIASTASHGQNTAGSNKVKITPVVKYEWEQRYYVGNLVAVHRDNIFVAYTLKGKYGGNVRVINRKTAERALLKDFSGPVVDIGFAHTDDLLLAAVDEIGNMFVYEVMESNGSKLITNLVLHIRAPAGSLPSEYHRVIWCPFIPEESDDSTTDSTSQDASRLLALTHDERAEIWNIEMVIREMGNGSFDATEITSGLITINGHVKPITDAAFSPDGTALATASVDGDVKFFQVYMNEGASPRCLHQWKPHDGQPLSALFFLDDHKSVSADAQFWKFALTGCNNNQEIKIWSCESWNCLQTIRFFSPPNVHIEPCMKACLDLGANYLVLTDINRKVLYVLQLHQDNSINMANVSCVSEFILTRPCLSFAILEASAKKFKKSLDESVLDDMTTGELERGEEHDDGVITDEFVPGCQVRLYTIQTRTLQELLIQYIPDSAIRFAPSLSLSSISQDDTGIRDELSDMSMSIDRGLTNGNSMNLDTSGHTRESGQPLLLTPDAFLVSPGKSLPEAGDMDVVRGSGSTTSSFTQVSAINDDIVSPQSSIDRSAVSSNSTLTQVQTPTSLKEMSPQLMDQTPILMPFVASPPSDGALVVSSCSTPRDTTPGSVNVPVSSGVHVSVDDMFNTQSSGKLSATSLNSTASAEDLKDVSKAANDVREAFDEDDEEVAEVMKDEDEDDDEVEDEEDIGTPIVVEVADEKLTEGSTDDDDAVIEGTLPTSNKESDVDPHQTNTLRAWPPPPEVNMDPLIHTDNTHRSDEEDDAQLKEIEESMSRKYQESKARNYPDVSSGAEEMFPKPGYLADPLPHEIIREVVDKEALQQLQTGMAAILSLVQSQQQEIQSLHQQLERNYQHQEAMHEQMMDQRRVELQQSVAASTTPEDPGREGKLEAVVAARLEQMLGQLIMQENKKICDAISENQSREQQRHERFLSMMSHNLSASVEAGLEKAVRAEFRNTVTPNIINNLLDPLNKTLQTELAQKLTTADSLLKENIGKMVRSRQTLETLGTCVSGAIQVPMQTAFRDAFQGIVVPAFERACQALFQQVKTAFSKGTNEYTQHLESHLEQVRRKTQEGRDPIELQLQSLISSFKSTSESLQNKVISTIQSEVTNQMIASLTSLKSGLLQSIREVVKEEVGQSVREHELTITDTVMTAMRSMTATPVPVSPDPHVKQNQVMALLKQGQVNDAFQLALSAANLDLVMFVCEAIEPAQVFSQSPCIINQPVLLSLIQQLSADLSSNIELRHKYIEEAVMNLDMNNAITQEHIQSVLHSLIQKLKTYLAAYPNGKMTKQLKMLLMVAMQLLA